MAEPADRGSNSVDERAGGTDVPAAEDVTPPEDVTSPDELRLAADFPDADRDQWRELVSAVLHKSRGRNAELPDPVEDALRHSVGGGVEVAPLYVAADAEVLGRSVGVPGLAPYVRGRRVGFPELTGWDVRARHAHPDVGITREAIATDLNNGVTSLWLVLGDGAIPVDALSDVLADVLLDVAPVVLQAGSATTLAADALFALAAEQGIEPGELVGNLGADPFGDAVCSGSEPDLADALALVGRCRADFPAVRAIVVDGTVFHRAGAGVVEELGCSLAAAVGYLRALTDDGIDVDAAFDALDFRYSAGADQFLTIAGLRAARRLWNRVGDVSGASPGVRGQRQHAVTSSVMMTRRDPWVNMLRTTIACFAAGVGGADAVTVAPFDSELGLPDAFARRIARNTQTLLMEEGHLARVLDPAGGSWYVESLTDQLAAAAWDWFTEIERAGGLAAAMTSGLVAERLASVWADRRDRLAHRSDAITGVSEFPNLSESLPARDPYPTVAAASDRAGFPVVRAAGDFEVLRDRVDAVAAESDSRPAVFLARLGSLAASTPRTSFATNLYQVAGLETPSNGNDDDNAAIVSAFTDSGTSVACICGLDEAYGQRAAELAEALSEVGATLIWQASSPDPGGLLANRQDSGRPGEIDRIDGHIFAGCDALAVLDRTLEALGVPGAAPTDGGESA